MSNNQFNGKRRTFGIVSTILFHLVLLLILLNTISAAPPKFPPQQELVIEFEPEEEIIRPARTNPAPAETIRKGKPVVTAKPDPKPNNRQPKPTQPTATPSGDVELPIPEEPQETIKPGTLFTAATGKPQDDATSKPSSAFPGNPDGNSDTGALGSGTGSGFSFDLGGRSIIGTPPQPIHSENIPSKDGIIVVVEISVDKDGKVTKARAGVSNDKNKTTTSNKKLWDAAQKAALGTKFSESKATVQYGYIVYRFKWQ